MTGCGKEEAGVMDVSDVTRHAAAHGEDWTALYLIRLTTPPPHHNATLLRVVEYNIGLH